MDLKNTYGRARLDDRLVNELIGLCHGISADGVINTKEAEYLQKWLITNGTITENPLIRNLLSMVNTALEDGTIDEQESTELVETFRAFSGGNYEAGEVTKATTLPFNDPIPELIYSNSNFCFTGTFAFGSRKECENKIAEFGGSCGSVTKGTDYLIIGIYATDSWKHSSYGNKIIKAVEYRDRGVPIKIIGEQHWVDSF